MFPSIMAPKIPILVSQCEMDHQKPTILLIFSTFSLGGCGGHPMSPELDLKDKSQMSRPNEYTDNFQSNSICIFTSVRAKSKKPLCPRTQCSYLQVALFSLPSRRSRCPRPNIYIHNVLHILPIMLLSL